MSKYSLKNILLGFGIGLVFVSMINLNAAQRKMTVDDIRKEAEKYNLIVLDQQEIIKQTQPTPTATPAATAAPTSTPVPTATPAPASAADITVNIPDGETSESIADILADSGLLKDKKAFLKRLDELEKASRLHSGKFTIKKDTGIDGIIDILSK